MRISATLVRKTELRTGTPEERELYLYALKLEQGIKRNSNGHTGRPVKTAQRIITA